MTGYEIAILVVGILAAGTLGFMAWLLFELRKSYDARTDEARDTLLAVRSTFLEADRSFKNLVDTLGSFEHMQQILAIVKSSASNLSSAHDKIGSQLETSGRILHELHSLVSLWAKEGTALQQSYIALSKAVENAIVVENERALRLNAELQALLREHATGTPTKMIPRPELDAVNRRAAYLAGASDDPPADIAAVERCEPWDALRLRRTIATDGIAPLLGAGDGARRYHLRLRLLDHLFGKSGAVASRTVPAESRVRLIVDDLTRDGMHDALLSRTRSIDVFRFPAPVVDVVTTFRAAITSTDDRSVTARMRTVMGLSQFYRTLTGLSPAESIASAAKNLHQLSLSMSTLRVVLGHAVPLVRTVYDGVVARPLLANLAKWLEELTSLRREYVQQYRRNARMSDTGDTPMPEEENDLYTLALNAELTRLVNARMRIDAQEDASFPDVVYFDKSLNEVATPLVERAAHCWSNDPDVLSEILRLATRIRSLRKLVIPVLDRLFFDDARTHDERVQIAAIELATAFSGGFRRDEARLETEFLYVDRGEGRYRPLEDEVREIFASDEGVRERIDRIARDRAGRTERVRAAAFRALLEIITLPDERQSLYELATHGDPPLARAFLEYVVHDGTHSAFDFVRRLHDQSRQLGIEPLFFEAVAATHHVESAQFLRALGSAPRPQPVIEELIRRQGAEGVVQEMSAHRQIRHHIAEANDASEQRERAIVQESELRLTAIREASAAMENQLQADHANAEKHLAVALSAVDEAREVITLEKFLRRLAALLERVPPVRSELAALQQNLNRLANHHNELARRVERAYDEAQSMERQVEAHGRSIRDHEQRANTLRREIAASEADLGRLQERLRSLGRERPSDPNEAAAIQRRIRDVRAEIDSASSRIRIAGAELGSVNDAIADLRDEIQSLERQIDRAEDAIAALNVDISANRTAYRNVTVLRDAQEAILNQLLTEIAAVKRDIAATENTMRGLHRALDARIATLEATRLQHATRQQAHQVAAATAIRAADRERQRFIELSSRISELESRNAQLLATVAANRQQTAEQIAGIDAAARIAEQQRRGTRRLRQSAQLNVDLLMSIVKALVEPGAEARHVIEKMESIR